MHKYGLQLKIGTIGTIQHLPATYQAIREDNLDNILRPELGMLRYIFYNIYANIANRLHLCDLKFRKKTFHPSSTHPHPHSLEHPALSSLVVRLTGYTYKLVYSFPNRQI